MMKTTTSLSWKNLASKLHPPSPSSSRESQRLLADLNASSKRSLDPRGSKHDTLLHLDKILTHPLFNTSATRKNGGSLSKNARELGLFKRLGDQPMDLFQAQVAAGTASLEFASVCLQTELRRCLASPAVKSKSAVKSSNADARVREWLWSSGMDESGVFLQDSTFLESYAPFAVTRRGTEPMWAWLQRIKRGSVNSPSWNDRYSRVLSSAVKTETRFGNGLASAVILFEKSVLDSQHTETNIVRMHQGATWSLTKLMLAHREPSWIHKINNDVIEKFIRTAEIAHGPDSWFTAYHTLHLATVPNPDVVLRYFRKNCVAPATFTDSSLRKVGSLKMALKAAHILLARGSVADAIWLREFVQKEFPQYIEAGKFSQKDSGDGEHWSTLQDEGEKGVEILRSLETLAVH
ncbi:Saccharopine dehydrogenase [Puttea exsequens]|nr:Saccharopine dehydrogenase [Puttea exsequens]